PEYHRRWWPQALNDPARRMLILEAEGVPVAIVIFMEITAASAKWGLYTAPEDEISRGRCLRAWIAADFAGMRYAFEILGVETLWCEILYTHSAALRLRERTGTVRTQLREVAGRPPFVEMKFTRSQYEANDWQHPFDGGGEMEIAMDSREARALLVG